MRARRLSRHTLRPPRVEGAKPLMRGFTWIARLLVHPDEWHWVAAGVFEKNRAGRLAADAQGPGQISPAAIEYESFNFIVRSAHEIRRCHSRSRPLRCLPIRSRV